MAFPTLGILDDFNSGASQNLTARTGWGAVVLTSGDATFVTDITPIQATVTAGPGSNYYDTSSADAEAYCKLAAFNPNNNEFFLATRITAVGASPTYYALDLANSGLNDFQIVKVVAGTRTLIGSTITQAITNGDSVGISVVGTQVTSFYKSGAGAWVQKDTVSDSSISGSGFVGGVRATFTGSVSIDDFGGGGLASAPGPRATLTVRRLVGAGA